MGNGQPIDDSGTSSTKTPTPAETPQARPDDAHVETGTGTSETTSTSPMAQIAVENQTGTLPGTRTPDTNGQQDGQLEITPLPGATTGTTDVSGTATEVAGATTDVAANPPEKPKTRSEELTEIPPANSYQDGRSDAIDLTVKRIAQLPANDPARQIVLRELADSFENGKTYAERLRAAKALLQLTRGTDGKLPDTLVMRDLLVPDKGHWTQATYGRGGKPSQWVVDTPAHHELKPLAGSTVLNFLNNSAETIEEQTRLLKGKPLDDKDRQNLVTRLTTIFQTYGNDSPEKLAAAKALLELNRKADGSVPDVLGTRDVDHPKQTRTISGGRAGTRTETVKEAWTEHINTTKQDVEKYLSTRSEGILRDTAGLISQPQAGAEQRQQQTSRALNVFLDSKDTEDKTAAAVSLLELNRSGNGTIADTLASRVVHIPAKTERVTPVGRGAKPYDKILEPARDRTDTVTKADAITFLTKQLEADSPPRGRLMAADALKQAGVIDAQKYNEVLRGIVADDRAPESIKAKLRETLGANAQQETLREARDGRVAPNTDQYVSLDQSRGGTRDRLEAVLGKLALNPELSRLVTEKQLEDMHKELAEGKFGPASREFYNKSVVYLNDLTNGMAVAILSRNGTLPVGCPIEVPRDTRSGRAISDDLYRAQVLTGRLGSDLKVLQPGEMPNPDKLLNTAVWDAKAVKEMDGLRLKWEVSVFDEALQAFNKNGKLDSWKSKEGMTLDQMRELQSARGEWMQLGMQVRNYAHSIAYFNKATTDASNIPRLSFSGAEFSVFSDEALSDKNFPGKVTRENGKITSIEIDMPTSLDRHDATNLEKIARMQAWLEKYGPRVDQVTKEIAKASVDSGRLVMWGDTELPHDEIDPITGKKYNFISHRFETETVKVKMPDGTEEERIRVTSSRQKRYAGDLSLYKVVGDISDVGDPVTSGEVKVNGKVLSLDAGENGVTLGTNGGIKVTGDNVDAEHARMRVAPDGRIFIKDNGSKAGTYVGGEKIDGSKWVEVFPGQTVTLGKPPASLSMGTTEQGEATFNGQALKVGETVKVGTGGGIRVEGEGVASEHALMRVNSEGKIFIKDNGSATGTYVNGKRVTDKEWTQISTNDKVTFGPPAQELDIQADVRLYRPGDMVTVLMDNQMQLMPAENLSAWKTEAKTWHYGGKGVMAALDLGMLVTGTIELRGAMMAAEQAGKMATKTLVMRALTAPGAGRALWHMGLGATGLMHQFIENELPGGRTFMHIRGYAMMADIFYGSVVKDAAALGRRVFGGAAPIQEGSALTRYLDSAPRAALLHKITDKAFFYSNFYFAGDIGAHMSPAFFNAIREHDAETLLKAGMLLRADEYTPQKDVAPQTTLEDQVRRYATPETRDKINTAKQEAVEKAKLPDSQKSERNQYLEQLTSRYLDAQNTGDKTAAAFALLSFHAQSKGSIPDVLGTRWKSANDNPDNVSATEVRAFLNTQVPRSINQFDKQLQSQVDAQLQETMKVADAAVDSPERKAAVDKLLGQFVNSTDNRERVAAAMSLMILGEENGRLKEVIGTADATDGRKVEVKSADLQAFVSQYQNTAIVDRFDGYAASMKGNQAADAILARTRQMLTQPENAEGRKAELSRLMDVYEKTSNRDEKAAAALSMLFLNSDRTTGALPKAIASIDYEVQVPRYVSGGSGSYGTSVGGGSGRLTMGKETRSRELATEDVLTYLKGNMPAFSPGTRLAVADALYRASEAPMSGRSPLNDLGGVQLSVLEDPRASAEAKRQALVNASGLGLSDVMEIHRFDTEPGIEKLQRQERASAEADLYGRNSSAMEKALIAIVEDKNADKDLRALASGTLFANSEPDPAKRRALLEQIQADSASTRGNTGAYYNKLFGEQSAVIKSLFNAEKGEFTVDDNDRIKLFRSALLLSKAGNWKEFGISDAQIALALEESFRPDQPLLSQQALDPMLRHYKDLDEVGRGLFKHELMDVLGTAHGTDGGDRHRLRLDILNRLGQISTAVGPEFAAEARATISKMLTRGTNEFAMSDETVRAAAIKALSQIGSNDDATQALLKKVAGSGGPGDPSPLVRSAAVDRLSELKPVGLNQLAVELLAKEKDPEVLRKIGLLETGSRRLDPDSAEYRERFRQALNRLMEAGANKYSLAQVPDFIRQNYPMLEWEKLVSVAMENYHKDYPPGSWQKKSKSTGEYQKPYLDAANAEMNRQFDSMIANARKPEGDMERRALAWIIMSNGRFFDQSTQENAVQRAAQGLQDACRYGDAKTKQEVAPLLLMAIATQDRMPYTARDKLVTGLTYLNPGGPDSPVTKQDAGVAVLAALKRQFERTPRSGSEAGYQESHDLQMKLLDLYSRYQSSESIPILEAIAEENRGFTITRNETGNISDVGYFDQSKRSVSYTSNNEIWRMSHVTKGGVAQTLIRKGQSEEWYEEGDTTQKTVFRGSMSFDQKTGAFSMTDSYGKSTVYTPEGSKIERTGNQVNKVTYPNGSSRELLPGREIYTNHKGEKQIWVRDGNTNTWYRDNDKAKKSPWTGTFGFDADGNYTRQEQGKGKEVIKSDGAFVRYSGANPVYAAPGPSDQSAHPMPLVRDRARQILANLRDDTATLRNSAQLDSQSTPLQLANNLKRVVENPLANSEEVTKAIFTAGLSKPLAAENEPRRQLLYNLLNDPHERIRMAAAHVLFKSDSVADRQRAAVVIADMSKNGSRTGYKQDANNLVAAVRNTPSKFHEGDENLLDTTLARTLDQPRVETVTPRSSNDRTVDQQEKYEQATGAMIRDTQITLDDLENPEWWEKHGFALLEAGKMTQAVINAVDETGNSFGFLENAKYLFWDDSGAQQKYRDAIARVNQQRDDQVTALVNQAKSNDDSEQAKDARKALAFIVLTNGYPLTPLVRDKVLGQAADALAHIYQKGGPGADYAEQIITAALVANPGIKREIREKFTDAVAARAAQDQSVRGSASKTKSAALLSAALEAEHLAMPQRGQPGNRESVAFQTKVLNHLDKLQESIAEPVLEAISKGHPDAGVQQRAAQVFAALRDGTQDIFANTVPDTTTSSDVKARDLTTKLQNKDPKYEEQLIREMYRLAHPTTFDKAALASDPRTAVLRTALSSQNDRVRLAAARILSTVGDARGTLILSGLRDSARGGIASEADTVYGTTLSAATGKLDAARERVTREALNHPNERVRVTAARLLAGSNNADAQATEALVKLYASNRIEVRSEAFNAIKKINETPIAAQNDARRAVLLRELNSENEKVRLAAAWMLSHSKVKADFDKSAVTLSALAVKGGSKAEAQTLLKDMIAFGGDEQQRHVLASWNAAWNQGEKNQADRPPTPTQIDQAQKYFRLSSTAERARLFAMPESKKKAIVMQLSGMTDAQLEATIQPAPVSDVLAPALRDPFRFDPFQLGRRDTIFPLPGSSDWTTGNAFLSGSPLAARWQPDAGTRWPGSIQTSTTRRARGSNNPMLDVLKQHGDNLGASVVVGQDGRLTVQLNGSANGNKNGSRLLLPGADGTDQLLPGNNGEAVPEFSEFLTYLATQRQDVLQRETIKASELSTMFLQYLRQREAGLQTGYMLTPSMYDPNVEVLTSDPRAIPWYTRSNGIRTDSPQWKDVQKQREQQRMARLDEQLTRYLTSQVPNGDGPHWRSPEEPKVATPEVIARPPVETLDVNRLGIVNILPADLLFQARRPNLSTRIDLTPRTGSNSTKIDLTTVDLRGIDVSRPLPLMQDVEIPVSALSTYMLRNGGDGSLRQDRVLILNAPDRNNPRSSYQLSPGSQAILRMYRLQRLQDQVVWINKTLPKTD